MQIEFPFEGEQLELPLPLPKLRLVWTNETLEKPSLDLREEGSDARSPTETDAIVPGRFYGKSYERRSGSSVSGLAGNLGVQQSFATYDEFSASQAS